MIAQGRWNDTVVHTLPAGNGSGRGIVWCCNTTSSAATVRIFNPFVKTEVHALDQDDALEYDTSIPANTRRGIYVDLSRPVHVRNGTANAITFTLEAA